MQHRYRQTDFLLFCMHLIIKSIILIKELAHILIHSICGINLTLGNKFANQCVRVCVHVSVVTNSLENHQKLRKHFLFA